MRAQRAKLKFQRNDMMVAPDKRSAVRGNGNKMNLSLFSSLALRAARKAELEKRERVRGGLLPGAVASAALPRATILPPLWGFGDNRPIMTHDNSTKLANAEGAAANSHHAGQLNGL